MSARTGHEVGTTIEQQRRWAIGTGRGLNEETDRFRDTADALFRRCLDPNTAAELAAGAGGELDRLASLRSSAALAVNVFGPWRSDPGPIASVLGGDPGSSRLRFEAVFPTGLPGTPPHLDVVIDGGTTRLAVESKFLEPYSPASNEFRPSYFSTGQVWDGLPGVAISPSRLPAESRCTDGLARHSSSNTPSVFPGLGFRSGWFWSGTASTGRSQRSLTKRSSDSLKTFPSISTSQRSATSSYSIG